MQAKPDILHLHNLHGGYFDLGILPDVSKQIPTVLTLHDEWTYTGHCAQTFGCSRWERGCGKCPDLSIYPPIRRDATAHNWRRKADIYMKSRLHLAAPSHWLLNRALQSCLNKSIIDFKVIPNGIDLSVFRPGNKALARQELCLPPDAWISLFVGFNSVSNRFKDYGTVESAVRRAGSQNGRPHYLVCVGETGSELRRGAVVIQFIDYQFDRNKMARYYQAADVFLQASHADTFPTTVLEAMGCGTPVVATQVGGIPEQIEEGVTGFLVQVRNPDSMADRIVRLQNNKALRKALGINASQRAKGRFSLERMVGEYLNWYKEILRHRTFGH
jgi:glycosyltransferase involved in cell wall biosynthesis